MWGRTEGKRWGLTPFDPAFLFVKRVGFVCWTMPRKEKREWAGELGWLCLCWIGFWSWVNNRKGLFG